MTNDNTEKKPPEPFKCTCVFKLPNDIVREAVITALAHRLPDNPTDEQLIKFSKECHRIIKLLHD